MNKRSQIATILTLAIAAIFLFIVITINIAKVSERKTIISNITDGAGLLLASGLGSVSSGLRHALGLYGRQTEDCDPNWKMIIGIALIIGGIAITAASKGILSVAGVTMVKVGIAGITAMGGIAMAGIGALMVSHDLMTAYTDPGLVKEMQIKFQNMTAEQRLFESAIQFALFTAIDDPAYVPDRFDVDRDGLRYPEGLDKIPRFNHWYFQRLNDLPRLGEIIEEIYHYLFTRPPQFDVLEDTETWDALESHLLVDGSWRIGEWLRDDLKPFINTLYDYGYGVEFANDYSQANIEDQNDDLGMLYKDIKDFEKFSMEVYNISKDMLIGSFEVWFTQFYNSESAQDWYDRMGEWVEQLNNWIAELEERHAQVLQCSRDCGGPGPWVCLEEGEGECCERICLEECIDATTGEVYCCGGCECIRWCGCDPAGLYDCRLCYTDLCYPSATCETPTGGTRNCCESGCMLYLPPPGIPGQPPDIQEWATGCSPEPCPANSCCDWTYYGPNTNKTRIQPYIQRLRQFRASIINFRNFLINKHNEAEAMKDNPWTYRAIYAWKDKVLSELGETVEAESPAHMVYVRIDVPSSFKFPYIAQERTFRWWLIFPYPAVCRSVKHASGRFNITVARYDEDIAKRGPLSNFWRFKFRRQSRGDEAGDLALLRSVADSFSRQLDGGFSTTLNRLISVENADRLGEFAYDHGIASRITVNYGPGYTYRPEELPGEADPRNEDIYIVQRHR